MSHARRILSSRTPLAHGILALFLAAAAPACDDEVLTVPTDASTSDRAADSPAAKSDAATPSDAAASSDTSAPTSDGAASSDDAAADGNEGTDSSAD